VENSYSESVDGYAYHLAMSLRDRSVKLILEHWNKRQSLNAKNPVDPRLKKNPYLWHLLEKARTISIVTTVGPPFRRGPSRPSARSGKDRIDKSPMSGTHELNQRATERHMSEELISRVEPE
jgi:hypothetical protein